MDGGYHRAGSQWGFGSKATKFWLNGMSSGDLLYNMFNDLYLKIALRVDLKCSQEKKNKLVKDMLMSLI